MNKGDKVKVKCEGHYLDGRIGISEGLMAHGSIAVTFEDRPHISVCFRPHELEFLTS